MARVGRRPVKLLLLPEVLVLEARGETGTIGEVGERGSGVMIGKSGRGIGFEEVGEMWRRMVRARGEIWVSE